MDFDNFAFGNADSSDSESEDESPRVLSYGRTSRFGKRGDDTSSDEESSSEEEDSSDDEAGFGSSFGRVSNHRALASKAMRLAHDRGIPLKKAWVIVKGKSGSSLAKRVVARSRSPVRRSALAKRVVSRSPKRKTTTRKKKTAAVSDKQEKARKVQAKVMRMVKTYGISLANAWKIQRMTPTQRAAAKKKAAAAKKKKDAAKKKADKKKTAAEKRKDKRKAARKAAVAKRKAADRKKRKARA